MSTFLQIRTSAALRFRDVSNNVITDAQWKEYVNEAYNEVLTANPLWPWNEAAETTISVTSTGTASLGTRVFQINWAYDATNDRKLYGDQGKGSQWQHGLLRSDSSATPERYKLRGSNIDVYPTPTSTISLRAEVVTRPAEMVNDGDFPVFPDAYHRILVDGAVAMAYLDDGNAEQYQARWSHFQDRVKALEDDLLGVRSETYPAIRDTFFG